MSDDFAPDENIIELRPVKASIGHGTTTEGYEAVSVYIEDDKLGAFNILISPHAAVLLCDELSRLLAQLYNVDDR